MIRRPAEKLKALFRTIVKVWAPSRKVAPQKSRLKALLAWIAKGAEHTCPT